MTIVFGEMRLWKSDKMLVLQNVDGVNYMHVKQAGLLFVATTRVNLSPALVLELLQRIARVTKDYLGVLNEDSLRKNFVLVYELLDEMIVSYFPNACVHYCPSYSQSNCDRFLQF
jgi:AP-4 complex subunit mu-1